MYIELNFGSLLKSLKLTIGHLKVDKFFKTLNSLGGQKMYKYIYIYIYKQYLAPLDDPTNIIIVINFLKIPKR